MIGKDFFVSQVEGSSQKLYCVARSLLRSDEDCKDALQEAVLKAWANRGSLRSEAHFVTWLTRILINECRNIQRRQARSVPVAEVYESGERQPEDIGLRAMIDALPEKLRLVVALHYVDGFSVAETARALRVTQSAVRGRLYMARKALKQALTDEEVRSV